MWLKAVEGINEETLEKVEEIIKKYNWTYLSEKLWSPYAGWAFISPFKGKSPVYLSGYEKLRINIQPHNFGLSKAQEILNYLQQAVSILEELEKLELAEE